MLAHAELVAQRRDGTAPILLLDEVTAHLDTARRTALFSEVLRLGAQAWMTGTDRAVFAPLEGRRARSRWTTVVFAALAFDLLRGFEHHPPAAARAPHRVRNGGGAPQVAESPLRRHISY